MQKRAIFYCLIVHILLMRKCLKLLKKRAQAAFIEKRMPYTLGLSQQRVKKSPRTPHYKGGLAILLNLLNVVCPR
jgi:hypothetical protein